MKTFLLALLLCLPSFGQQYTRWFATTGDVSLSGAGTTATIQQLSTGGSQILLDQIVVYCSVNCNITQAANGTAATSTAGTIIPILPYVQIPTPATFWTSSNVGAGTAQGGIVHLPAGGTITLCLSTNCGNGQGQNVVIGTGQGAAANYSVTINSVTGTVNITFYGRNSS